MSQQLQQTQLQQKQEQQSQDQSVIRRREPPVWFDLSELHPDQAMFDMGVFAKNFYTISPEFLEKFFLKFSAIHYGPNWIKSVIIGYIPAPPTSNANSEYVVQKVIGQNGYYLKKTTELSDVHFIWYEPSLNNFLFWAPNRFSIVKAMKAIRQRIIKYYDLPVPEAQEDEYADMPGLVPIYENVD
jgi:hypothetical protein